MTKYIDQIPPEALSDHDREMMKVPPSDEPTEKRDPVAKQLFKKGIESLERYGDEERKKYNARGNEPLLKAMVMHALGKRKKGPEQK
jgi:hypothetical protein